MLQVTTAQRKLAKLRKRNRVVQGGTSSSKTFTIIPFLIDYAVKNPMKEISITSESMPHLKRGCIKDFTKIMKWCGLWDFKRWNSTDKKYTFSNGSYIEFFSVDNEAKVLGARRNVLFVNEANHIKWETYYQMAIRTSEFIYIDYNPTHEFWAHEQLIGDSDTDFIILTYHDNEALDQTIRNELERARVKALTDPWWDNWYRVYGLGEVGRLMGTVFNNWEEVEEIPKNARLEGFGLDFGFTNSSTACVAVYYYDGSYYYDEVLYGTELTNQDIADELKIECGQNIIYADPAEPKSIKELQNAGLNCDDALKGPDSVMYGIDLMQQGKFFVTSTSENLIKELRRYVWKTNKDGAALNEPVKAFDHAIDAIRYFRITDAKYSGQY